MISFLARFDLFPDLHDHLLQQHLAFLLCLGIDRMHLALALCVGGRITPLKEVIVELVDPACSRFAVFALVRGERWAYRRFAADAALDLLRRLQLHGAGDVAVNINRRSR